MTRSPDSGFALGKTFLHLALYLATRIVLVAQSPSPSSIERPWWEREPLRIIDLVTAFSEMKDFPPAEAAARKAAQGFNVEHLEIMSMRRGLDDRGFFFTSTAAGQQNSDYLRQYLPEAKKQGLRVMIYFNVHWYKTEFGSQHSDWLQVREDGTPLSGVYQTGTDFCVNSPWREWVFQVLRDLCAYSIDGIFFDGPIFFPETCYCRWCQEKFKSAYSTSLPSKKERKGKPFRTLLEFQAGSLRDFLRDSRQVIKSINPQIAFYMNGGVRGGNWATARLNRLLVEEQDILGSEGGFIYGDLLRVPIWKPGVTAKLLETQAPNKPRVIFAAAAHKPWTFSLLPAPELRLLYADSIANGANVWLGITPFELAQPEMKAVTDMNQFVAKNSAYLQQTRSEATTALVWSDTTANFYAGADAQMIDIDRVPQRSEVGNLDAEFSGLAEALLRSQTPFDVIDDVSLDQEDLRRYAAIFLPNVACMSEKSVSHLKQYVRNGGNLFATFETSLYDDTGIRRDDFALAELLGVTDQRKIIGPKRWDFMKPATASPLLAGIQRELLPSPAYHVRVTAKGAQPLLFFTKPLAGVYDGIPELSDDPSLLVNQFGKGKVIYFSGDLGSGIQSFHLAEFFRLIANITRELAPSPVLVEGAPQSLQVVLRSQQEGKRLLLHLLNFTGEMTRPMSRVLPLENARVSLLIQGRIKSVRTLMQPRKLQARTGVGGRVQIVLPRMDEYEVVVIETQN